ncbi:transposase domain-containing protein [Paremcibacter congregatus]|uniref:transposase domain-containing protein n=1 Tax=Paremcibacter congregatus TaxID=2043170 RepID=UPI0030ECA592
MNQMTETIKQSPLDMQEFYTAAEIAALQLPGLPCTDRAIQIKAKTENWHSQTNMAGASLVRKREGRGGGFEYHYSLLPIWAQNKLILDARRKVKTTPLHVAQKEQISRTELWVFYDGLSDKKKAKAKDRLNVLISVIGLEKGGMTKNAAVGIVSAQEGVSPRSIYNWFTMVERHSKEDWMAALVPHNAGRMITAKCDPVAWEFIKADYLRAERPTFNSCYRRLERAAAEHGWDIPAERTLLRRIDREIPEPVKQLARYGMDHWKQTSYPAQERDRSVFYALEAVNADGHKWDVFTKWPDGTTGRAMMVVFQDLYSGKVLSWRVDKSENKEAVRLAFGDMVEEYGIPEQCYLDNGRAFASKWLTGGTANRYRFKITDEDPSGIMTDMDVQVHWTLPYAGQSKPIERAFRDMCDDIAKDPRLHGAWAGNRIDNKPENYGERVVPLEDFLQVVEEGIIAHNARLGRRAKLCKGRSFDQTFAESYAQAPIRKATEVQKRLWLLAAEGVRAASRDGALKLMENRYWADFLRDHKGQKLIIRFDPQNMHKGLHVYRLDGEYLGFADVWDAAGFNDVEAARDHNSARKKMLRADKDRLAAERSMGIEQMIGYMPVPAKPEKPLDSKVVKPVFGDKAADQKLVDTMEALRSSTPVPAPLSEAQKAGIEALKHEFTTGPDNVVALPETAKHRFKKALELLRALEAGHEIDQDDALWLGGYQTTPEYRAQKGVYEDFGESYLQF